MSNTSLPDTQLEDTHFQKVQACNYCDLEFWNIPLQGYRLTEAQEKQLSQQVILFFTIIARTEIDQKNYAPSS